MLLRLGATPITSSAELLDSLGFSQTKPSTPNPDSYSDCSPDELKVIKLLAEPMTRDDLVRTLEMKTSEANILLSMMEIKGLIQESMGEIHLAN
jgi:predicted Rossmann fold nucleotide-binding protein DprA/Smf involved in DNA uptake